MKILRKLREVGTESFKTKLWPKIVALGVVLSIATSVYFIWERCWATEPEIKIEADDFERNLDTYLKEKQ